MTQEQLMNATNLTIQKEQLQNHLQELGQIRLHEKTLAIAVSDNVRYNASFFLKAEHLLVDPVKLIDLYVDSVKKQINELDKQMEAL